MLLAADMIEDVLGAKRSANPAGSGAIIDPREFLLIWCDGKGDRMEGGGGGEGRGERRWGTEINGWI